MKRITIGIMLACLMVTSIVFSSCSTSTSAATQPSTTTPTSIVTSTSVKIPSTTTTTIRPTSTSSTSAGNWWDKLGMPQYGSTMTLRISRDIVNWDPGVTEIGTQLYTGWLEQLFTTDWTLDPKVQPYQMSFWDNSFAKGQLVTSWEFTDPGTFVIHVRKGIHWQNIPPANGREFTADDIAYHFHRMIGGGDGFTKPASYWGTVAVWQSLSSVTATDKNTIVMKWNTPNPEFATENLEAPGAATSIENPEAVKQWGDVLDWHHAIGTGPFMLKDFVSGSSLTMVKNPDYWGYDERYPKNQLPYVDSLKYLIIPDDSTALAAMRSGKIDIMDGISLQNAQSIKKTNPEITQLTSPSGNGISIDPRNDKTPFNDIRVRKALQMAIDLPTIAQTYYGGTVDPSPLSLTSRYLIGWGFPYNQWPQDLKDEYAFNPTTAKKLLADAGYPNGFKTNIVVSSDCDLDLLQIVKSYFAQVNIDMEIRIMDPVAATAFVVTGHKHDAMAQRTAGTLGVTFYPLRQFNRLQTGQSADIAMVSDPVFDAFYPKALVATSTDDLKKLLAQANEYVARQHFVISMLQPNVFNLCQPWLNGYNAQYGSISGSNGPQLLFFYTARFWVDKNLKKSLGH